MQMLAHAPTLTHANARAPSQHTPQSRTLVMALGVEPMAEPTNNQRPLHKIYRLLHIIYLRLIGASSHSASTHCMNPPRQNPVSKSPTPPATNSGRLSRVHYDSISITGPELGLLLGALLAFLDY